MTAKQTLNSVGLLIFRVGIGSMMFFGHGLDKLERVFQGNLQFGDPLGIGSELSFVLLAMAESLMSLAIIFGVFTRLAAIPIVFSMLVAVFAVHISHPFGKMELPLMYAAGFFLLIFTGPGKFSFDTLICKFWHNWRNKKR